MNSTPFTAAALISMRDKSVNAAFMDFDNAVSHNPDALFVFYEGQDNDYFYPRLQRYSSRSVEPINCKGKTKVIGIYKILITKHEYDKYRKGFFIDKDYDLNTESFLTDFHVTSGYSVENYYMSDTCMEAVLKQLFNFHIGEPQLSILMSDYRQMRQRYLDAIVMFNVWYCAIKRKYGNSIKDVNLDLKMPKGYIFMDYTTQSVTQNYTMTSISDNFNGKAYPVTPAELSAAETYLKADLLKNLRGKYLLSFLLGYITYLQELFRNDPAYSSHKRNMTISNDNIMLILSPHADTEQELIDYIQRIAA